MKNDLEIAYSAIQLKNNENEFNLAWLEVLVSFKIIWITTVFTSSVMRFPVKMA